MRKPRPDFYTLFLLTHEEPHETTNPPATDLPDQNQTIQEQTYPSLAGNLP